MRNEQWEHDLQSFYSTNSPRFVNFHATVQTNKAQFDSNHHDSINKEDRGIGMDLQMTLVHQEYVALIEEKLNKLFVAMSINATEFIQSMKLNLDCNDETVGRLYKVISAYHDFIEFGVMMERKYIELYEKTAEKVTSTGTVDKNIYDKGGSSIISIDQSLKPMTSASMRICRVLWDLENIPVMQKDGMYTVAQLHRFLRTVDLMGPGIDTRITAFFNPFNKSISKKTIEQLNKSSVELVLASSKREDSDRKLGAQ